MTTKFHTSLLILLFSIFCLNMYAENVMNLIWESQGEHPDSEYGSSMTSMDYNGDGIDDLVVGSDRYSPDGNPWQRGKVYFYYGGDDFSTTPNLTITGTPGMHIGKSLHNFGDVNGDSYDDLGLYWNHSGLTDSLYTIEIYYGGTACDTIPDFSYNILRGSGDDAVDVFTSLYPIGDVNGDGFSDAGYVLQGVYPQNPYSRFFIIY
ncbi:MAG: VCBS repeat-containing protein, partial [Candidatus Cloacimonetes bacterium]|nr:VCBS repeat-containing protein [Candidatus Cloacimonadota bacterium]